MIDIMVCRLQRPRCAGLSHHLIRSLDNQGATGSQTSGQRPRLAVRWSDLSVSDWEAELHAPGNGAAAVSTVVRRHLPKRLAASLVGGVVDPQKPCGSLTKGEAAKLTERLAAYQLPVSGHQGCALSCGWQAAATNTGLTSVLKSPEPITA
eukprot:jgi/Ulvmu1/2448/UM135_0008.1